MRKTLYILIPLLVALTLRLYPTLISGMPFSTDSWPITRNTELLIKNTPIVLNSGIFDGYNNFMPANSLFGTVLSQVINIAPIDAMALGIPIVAALTIPTFYVLVNKITKNSKTSLAASILLATAFPYTMFTAGVTKETYASLIYITLILIFLLKHNWKTTLLFSTVSVALVLSHQATAFLTILVITGMAIASYLSKGDKQHSFNSNKSNILFIAILTASTALYFGLYAYPAITLTLTPSDLLTVGSYLILVVSLVLFFVYRPYKPSRRRTILKCTISFLLPFMFLFLSTKVSLIPGAPILPLHYLLYELPLLIALPLIIYGLNDLQKNNSHLVYPLFWLAPLIALGAYAVFSNSLMGLSLAYRLLDFMLPPLIILTAIALNKISSLHINPQYSRRHKFPIYAVVSIIIIFAAISTYTLYAAVSLQERYLGYFWSYKPSEYAASDWTALNANNQTISADVKVQYLLNNYFNTDVTPLSGLNFLEGNGPEPNVLYIYSQMYKNGYVLSQSYPVALPTNWTDKLTDYNRIYTNNEVTIYAK